MRIGLTYDLKNDYLDYGLDAEILADLDRPSTIDGIEATLVELGYQPDRIGNLDALVRRLARGETWELVFNISEGLYGYGRESAVPALLDARRIPYVFSDPLALAVTLHKPTAKQIFRQLGVPTPEFRVVSRPEDVAAVDLEMPVFVKPVAEGSSKGITTESLVHDRERLEQVCDALIRHHQQPVMVERFLPGREFTVGVVGTDGDAEALGTMEILVLEAASHSYSLEVKSAEDYQSIVSYRLCPEPEIARRCEELALVAWRGLGCRDGGRVDLRTDAEGQPHVLEINPLPGMHPVESDLTMLTALLEIPYRELLARFLASAHRRLGIEAPPRALVPVA